jgi:VWFA-related protein
VQQLHAVKRVILIATIACTLPAQQPIFSTDVQVVNLLATVRDRDGRFIKDLAKEDFVLLEDGRPQTITYFAHETDTPLSVGLLVDTSCSQIRLIKQERTASFTFFDQVLRDTDAALVLHFDSRVSLLQGFTSSRKEISQALNQLSRPKRCGTLLFDAIHDASEQLMKKQSGRKAYILLSDGGDVGSTTPISTAIEFAQRADTLIYSVLYADHPLYLPRSRKVMQRLAQETGGEYFAVSKDKTIESIYAEIEQDLRSQYSIGYKSDQADSIKKFRKISLTTNRADLIVSARHGYYPK